MNFDTASELSPADALLRVLESDRALEREPNLRTVHAWIRSLKSVPAVEAELGTRLHDRIRCLTTLARRIETSGALLPDDSPVIAWLDGVRLANAWWQHPGVVDPGGDFPGGSPQSAVLCATTWSVLAHPERLATLPAPVRDAVEICHRKSVAWCARLPVPPGSDCNWDPDRYVDRRALTQIAPSLRSELQKWDDLLLEDFADSEGESMARSGFNIRRFGNARDLLVETCENLEDGWSLEFTRVQTNIEAVTDALKELDEASALADAMQPLAGELELFRTALDLSVVSAGPASAPRAQATATIHGSTGTYADQLQSLARWSEHPQHEVPLSWQDRLGALLQKLPEAAEQSLGREILNLLVDLDSQIANPSETPRGQLQFRDQLRRVLRECFPYEILDSALIGRQYEQVRDRVRVRRTLPAGSPGTILFVARPGYLFQLPEGEPVIIRPAEVDISG